MRLKFVFAALLTACTPPPSGALDEFARPLQERNFAPIGPEQVAVVSEGETGRSFALDLEPGSYAFLAACEAPCRRVHLAVYGPDGQLTGADRPDFPANRWWLEAFAANPSRFTVTLQVLECDAPTCAAEFRAFRRQRLSATP